VAGEGNNYSNDGKTENKKGKRRTGEGERIK
jgi:hypothetical protein